MRNECYQESLRTEAIEIGGVIDVLAELSLHVRMGIVTTSKRTDFDLIHTGRGITRLMEFVLAREDYAHPKPHPEPYLTAVERFGATAAETLIVEDSARGLRSAVAAGIDCAIVRNEFTKTQEFSGTTHRIDSLRELVDLVS
ncbi:HAD family hydrolase [Microbacterium sp. GXF0217]